MSLENESDPRVLELVEMNASMEDIALIRGPRIQSAEQGIRELKAGNVRFFNGHLEKSSLPPNLRRVQTLSQTPFAAILGCADSRVPAEVVFDQGLGSLFNTRNAGNVVDPGALGSLQYAVTHLKPQVLVVLGHEGCSAVHSAMLPESERNQGI